MLIEGPPTPPTDLHSDSWGDGDQEPTRLPLHPYKYFGDPNDRYSFGATLDVDWKLSGFGYVHEHVNIPGADRVKVMVN